MAKPRALSYEEIEKLSEDPADVWSLETRERLLLTLEMRTKQTEHWRKTAFARRDENSVLLKNKRSEVNKLLSESLKENDRLTIEHDEILQKRGRNSGKPNSS